MKEIPVIVVTAKVDDCITKPFGPQKLLDAVKKVIDREAVTEAE